jgi:predicted DsbA family dithiol-disulfide isomerase
MAVFVRQQVAAYAAGEQHRFWQYAMFFLRDQGAEDSDYVNEQFLDRIAGLVPGLDEAAWERARHDRDLLRKVDSDQTAAERAGITGTPTIVFDGPRGKAQVSSGTPDYEALARAVRSVS